MFSKFVKYHESVVAQSCLTLCYPMDCSPPGSSVHGIFQARILEWVARPSSRGSSEPGTEPRSPTMLVDSLLSELSGMPKNTGVGSLSPLHGIFPTQEYEPESPELQADYLTAELPGKPHYLWYDMPIRTSSIVTLQCHLFPKSICMLYFYSISLLPLFTYLFGGH